MQKPSKSVPTIVVSGGKGGTGKSLIASNLAVLFKLSGKRVLLVDGDVENPNLELLLGLTSASVARETVPVYIFQPIFDAETCTKCGRCRDNCYKHAIMQFGDSMPELMEHLCSGCMTCMKICPSNAIKKGRREIGRIHFVKQAMENIDLLIGELTPEEAMSVSVVSALLKRVNVLITESEYDIIVVDSPPGAHCDVEMLLEKADLVIGVTEPTPFGEHDLGRILELLKMIGTRSAVIVNRATISEYKTPIQQLLEAYRVPILGEIPLDSKIVENYAKGVPFVLDKRDFPAKNILIHIFTKILTLLMEAGDNESIGRRQTCRC